MRRPSHAAWFWRLPFTWWCKTDLIFRKFLKVVINTSVTATVQMQNVFNPLTPAINSSRRIWVRYISFLILH
jgi:hypothetical protein